MPQTTLNVGMTCGGCSGAVSRILKKVEGVIDFDVNLEDKKVVVNHAENVSSEDIYKKVAVWGEAAGKEVSLA